MVFTNDHGFPGLGIGDGVENDDHTNKQTNE